MNKEEILRMTNGGLNVFRRYVPGDWREGKNFKNPFYKDTHASFNIYKDKKTGDYRMKDFGNPDYSGDCFALVALLEGRRCADKADFVAVMEKIANDLNLAVSVKSHCLPSSRRISATAERPLTASELDWWAKFGITVDVLQHYHVSAVSEITFPQGRKKATAAEPVFLYRFTGGGQSTRKLYAPCSLHRFFYLSKYDNQYFGFEQLPSKGETVLLTGGEKDVMTLASMGFSALCLNSETAVPDEGLLKILRDRFAHILLMYDADETGVRCSEEICRQWGGKYPVDRVMLPLKGEKAEKDVSDYVRMQLAAGLGREAVAAQLHTWVEQVIYVREEEAVSPYLIRLSQPPVKPEAVLRVNGSTLAATGGLVCITGGSGTGKSNYASALLAGTLQTVSDNVDTLGVQVLPNVAHKAVLLFDTEQSEYQSYCNLERLMHRAGVVEQPEHLQLMNLCSIPRRDRQRFIEKALESASRHFHGVYCAVIDGLADLIGSVNDEEEAVRIVEWAHRLAEQHHMVLITVVHTAAMPDKVRGHLGSELTRKASAVVDIETDKRSGNSVVKMLKMREGSVRDAGMSMFGWSDRMGMHVSMGRL